MAGYKSAALPALIAAVATFSPFSAVASGQLPQMRIEDRKLASFAACRAFLETTWHNDLKKADPQPLSAEGGTRQTLIDTKGVVAVDRQQAAYEVEEGWQFRRVLQEVRQIRTDYSYDRRHYECDGRHLTGTSLQGYALESYEPLPEERKNL